MRRDGAKAPSRPRPDDRGDDGDDGESDSEPGRERRPLGSLWRGDCYGGRLKPIGPVTQRRLHFSSSAVTSGRIVLERALDRTHERGRQVGTEISQSSRLLVSVRPRQLFDGRGRHRKLSRHEIEDQHTEAVEIALNRCRLAGKDLRREIQGCPGHARRTLGVAKLFARTEIHQHGAPAALAQDVLRLHVSMDEAGGMHGRKRRAQILTDDDRFARTERAAGVDDVLERFAFDVLHPEPDAAVVLLGAVDLNDVRMPDAREPARLVQHAFVRRRIGLSREPDIMEQLERDLTMQLRVPGTEHLARRAVPDPVEHHQLAPTRPCRLGRRRYVSTARPGDDRFFVGCLGRYAPIQRRDILNQPKVAHEAPIRDFSLRFGRAPVDLAPISDRGRKIRERAIVSPQRPSPLPVLQVPGSQPFALHPGSTFRAPPRSADNSAASRRAR